MFEILDTVYCKGLTTGVESIIPATVSMVVTLIKIGIPVILIIFGMMDLGKAVMGNDEKEMKAAQSKFIRRCLYAAVVFFVVAIVQFLVGVIDENQDDSEKVGYGNNARSCIQCFINGKCNGDSELNNVKNL